jgi:hypothetical protein
MASRTVFDVAASNNSGALISKSSMVCDAPPNRNSAAASAIAMNPAAGKTTDSPMR